jgi:hypothetical protein
VTSLKLGVPVAPQRRLETSQLADYAAVQADSKNIYKRYQFTLSYNY